MNTAENIAQDLKAYLKDRQLPKVTLTAYWKNNDLNHNFTRQRQALDILKKEGIITHYNSNYKYCFPVLTTPPKTKKAALPIKEIPPVVNIFIQPPAEVLPSLLELSDNKDSNLAIRSLLSKSSNNNLKETKADSEKIINKSTYTSIIRAFYKKNKIDCITFLCFIIGLIFIFLPNTFIGFYFGKFTGLIIAVIAVNTILFRRLKP